MCDLVVELEITADLVMIRDCYDKADYDNCSLHPGNIVIWIDKKLIR